MVEITAETDSLGHHKNFGGSNQREKIVANGTCSFYGREAAFRQIGTFERSEETGFSVSVRCDGCHSIMTISISDEEVTVHPSQNITGVNDVPNPIDEYYQEALDCLSVKSPNGAVTLFRKTIHAIAIHYDLAEVDESSGIYEMVNDLHEEGEINEKLRKSLLAVKDLGNDGAHINENEPDMEQSMATKELVDAVLSATVIADQRMNYAREQHPNEFLEDKGE